MLTQASTNVHSANVESAAPVHLKLYVPPPSDDFDAETLARATFPRLYAIDLVPADDADAEDLRRQFPLQCDPAADAEL